MTASTALAAVLCGLGGLGAGVLVQRAAARFVPARAGVHDAETVPAGIAPGGAMAAPPEAAPPEAAPPEAAPPEGAPPEAAGSRSVSVRVPAAVTVALTGLLCALAGLRFGATWQLPAFLLLAVAGVLLAVIDLEHRLLPNRILLPATAGAALLLTLAAAAGHGWSHLRGAAVGAVVLFVLFLVLALLTPSGLGMGDVKLAGWLGLYLGWLGTDALLAGAVAGFVVQALVAIALLAARRVGVKGEIPFGPALLAGAWIALFLAERSGG